MKTNIFNITALALMISTSFIAGRNTLNSKLEMPNSTLTEMVDESNSTYTMVEAKIINGEVLPYVNLPELEIYSSSTDEIMVSAKLVDGEVIPFVQLPELNIVAQ